MYVVRIYAGTSASLRRACLLAERGRICVSVGGAGQSSRGIGNFGMRKGRRTLRGGLKKRRVIEVAEAVMLWRCVVDRVSG